MNGKIIPAPGDKLNAIPIGMAGKHDTIEIGQQLIILVRPIDFQKRCCVYEPHIFGNGLCNVGDLVKRILTLGTAEVYFTVSDAAIASDLAEGKSVQINGHKAICGQRRIKAVLPQGDADLRKKSVLFFESFCFIPFTP